jgi:hypothetical protein
VKSSFYSEYRRKSNSVRFYLLTIVVCSIVLIGCAPSPTFIKSNIEQKQIKAIAIMPVVDKRNVVENTVQPHGSLSIIEELLSEKIMDKDYDVLLPGSVRNIIKEKRIENISPENLCSLLKVDGILFSELLDYNDVFFINHSLKMDFRLFDAKGDSLWINNIDASDKPYLSAIGYSLGWTIGISINSSISSEDKSAAILAGVAGAVIGYAIADGIVNETSRSIDGGLFSLPDGKGSGKEIIK